MIISLLATRALTRSLVASPLFVSRRVQLSQITRFFSVSRVSWTPAASATAKSVPKRAAATKSAAKKPAKKPVKKPAAKKTGTKARARRAVKKPTKPKKKVVKKKTPARIFIKAENKPPKKPGNAYTLYLQKHFAGLQRLEGERPIDVCQRVSKEASASWASFTDQEKQPFVDESATLTGEYKQKLAEYVKNTDRAIIREINRRRAKRGKTTIRLHTGLTNSFIQFLGEQRQIMPVHGGLKEQQEFVKAQGPRWNALSDAEKQVYKDRAIAINEARKN